MIKIGITGSLASGKSTVAKIFSGKKYPLFNSDKIVKKIYKSNYFKKKILIKFKIIANKNFKKEILKKISKNKTLLKKIEKIVHPLVRKEIRQFSKKNKRKKILVFEVPLLIESKLMSNYDVIIFVNSKKKLRLKRFLRRGKSINLFNFLDKRQLPAAKKIKYCDEVINNNFSLKKLRKNVKIIKKNYEWNNFRYRNYGIITRKGW